MSSLVDPCAGDASHACSHCSKVFARLCDLNKHAKSHSRPYKCTIPNCKYVTLGWPTAKELERHNNDKHSASPRTFACLFPPCSYASKRESNCKQHMEKAHNWNYVRSKSKGKRSPAQPKTDDHDFSPKEYGMALEADHSSSIASTSPPPLLAPPRDMDFILFDDDAIGEDDDDFYPGYGGSQGPESYLPWTSPMTRLRKNETFIEMFTQTYNGTLERAAMINDTGDPDVDPMLSDETLHDIENHEQANAAAIFENDVAIKVESPAMTMESSFPKKRKYETVEASSANPNLATSLGPWGQPSCDQKAGAGQTLSIQPKPWVSSGDGDDQDEGDRRPRKKSKQSSVEDFTDTSMPDIFRHAHPNIYDRNQQEKYSPCHTVHRDISTLVRHLSRPAHRLKVTDRTISSFDIEDTAFNHPRVGLCRCCWQTFSDRPTFDGHMSRPCEKVSKGKREKWRALFDTFTPLVGSTDAGCPSLDFGEHADERCGSVFGDSNCSIVDGHGRDAVGTPPTSVPSPMLPGAAAFVPSTRQDGRFISEEEHHKLQQEHQVLRQRHQQLERVAQVLLARQIIQETMRETTETNSDTVPPAVMDTPRNSFPSNLASEASDMDGLVQHMDSQSTDVDVHGLMDEMENTRRSLSRMNSGLSTASRSTIHHVPSSPPPRPAALPAHMNAGPQSKRALTHRPPPPSIPDSGYGTEQRRGSLGDILPAKLLTPPSSLGTTAQDNKGTNHQQQQQQVGPWDDKETTPTPAQSLSQSSQHPGFLTDQEMADYDDTSYNLFYQDNMQRHPLEFPTFDFSMQID